MQAPGWAGVSVNGDERVEDCAQPARRSETPSGTWWTFNRVVRESGEPKRGRRGPLFWGDGPAEQRTEAGRGGELEDSVQR